ncbi:MAG: amidophosphoribosyltransferase [Elusimicrobiaceae bacterium]|nr:amidophosphoribosyltransferase [Elusimicrobiaceae bacterium]
MCGIIGVENNKDSSALAYLGLFSLQHRGQESAGIVAYEKGKINYYRRMGMVQNVFTGDTLNKLHGNTAIGHVRYSTAGKSHEQNAQPFFFKCKKGMVSIAHNGNLTNAKELRKNLEKEGAIFQHSSDTEVIVHLIAREKGSFEKAIEKSLKKVEGAYSLLIVYENKLIAVRDPYGFRPLVLGKKNGKTYMIASETPAIEGMGGKYLRDIKPGEMVVVEKGKLKSHQLEQPKKDLKLCVFEQVYFSRPDSIVLGRSVQQARLSMGKYLAEQMKNVKADMVAPVPDSGMFATLGFAQASGIDFQMALVRNHYVGRSFIKPTQKLREEAVKMKLFPVSGTVKGKDIILIDDSIVRGTTSKKLVKILKEAGARKVHMAISSPPIISPCFYGIDTPNRQELIAGHKTIEEIKKYIGVDSLTYLTKENLIKAAGENKYTGFCSACFTGKYPTKIDKKYLGK